MKANLNLIIFAVVFGSVFNSNTVAAKAEDTLANKAATATLIKGQDKAFELFVNEKMPAFAQQEDWKTITTIVALYNQSPSKLMSVNADMRKQFNQAVLKLEESLNNSTEADASNWFKTVKNTEKAVNFLWNFDWNSTAPQEENVVLPTESVVSNF